MSTETIISFKISDVIQITHDTRQFRFELQSGTDFAFHPGDHVKIYPDPGDQVEWRPYTPTSMPDTENHFELIIKRYSDGIVSRFMHDRGLGDEVWMSGPHTGGHFVKGMATRIGMVAGGTGITPMISIIRTILIQGIDTSISLIFANKTVDDIILKDEFDGYEKEYPNFDRYYLVDKAPDGWLMGQGRITPDIMKSRLPEPSDQTVIFVCGPPMMQIDIRKRLIELGHLKNKIIFP